MAPGRRPSSLSCSVAIVLFISRRIKAYFCPGAEGPAKIWAVVKRESNSVGPETESVNCPPIGAIKLDSWAVGPHGIFPSFVFDRTPSKNLMIFSSTITRSPPLVSGGAQEQVHRTQQSLRTEEAILRFLCQPVFPSPAEIPIMVHKVAYSEKGQLVSLGSHMHDDLTGHSRGAIHRFT